MMAAQSASMMSAEQSASMMSSSQSASVQRSMSTASSVFEREASITAGSSSGSMMQISGGASGGAIGGSSMGIGAIRGAGHQMKIIDDDCPMHGDHGNLKIVRVCV